MREGRDISKPWAQAVEVVKIGHLDYETTALALDHGLDIFLVTLFIIQKSQNQTQRERRSGRGWIGKHIRNFQ